VGQFLGDETAVEMLGELRCSKILYGARGKAALDVDGAARVLTALSRFGWQQRDEIAEIDINPLFVLLHGVMAADALVVLKRNAGVRAQASAMDPAKQALAGG
jgi:acetate---CoA ligase (ADP-forming)